MKIYYLKWSATGRAPEEGGAAYTDKARAEQHARYCNERLSWKHGIFRCRWIIGTLDLKPEIKEDEDISNCMKSNMERGGF